MTAAAPQLFRLAPGLTLAAQRHQQILSLTLPHLSAQHQDRLRRLLGELTSAAWSDGYQASIEESRT